MSAGGEGIVDAERLVRRLFAAFNERDESAIAELCDEEMSFFPEPTAEAVGRSAPYSGRTGLAEYIADVARVWEVLQITPVTIENRGRMTLVIGRVYARSRRLGIRDLPWAWAWEIRDGRFIRGELDPSPERAAARFRALEPEPLGRRVG